MSHPNVGVPFLDLTLHHRRFAERLGQQLDALLESSQFILGEELERFESEFAGYIGVEHGVGVASGTAALQLAFEALLEPGDEVIVPAHTYMASALAVGRAGCAPRPVDVSDETGLLEPSLVEKAITERTRAILAVHLYGHPAPMEELGALASRHGLRLIEDCAQAHGALYEELRVGSLGDCGCFSFYPSKNLGALGDGGMVVTRDIELRDRIRALRHMGQRARNQHDLFGANERLDTLQAAFLRIKLPLLDRMNEQRRTAADRYRAALSEIGVKVPEVAERCTHVYHLFVIRHARRDAIQSALQQAGIGCGVYYPVPWPRQPWYSSPGAPREFPVAERIARDSLALPMFPEITPEQIRTVVRVIGSVL